MVKSEKLSKMLTVFNIQTAINDEVVGLIENDSTDEKPIGLITRKLSSVGTRFSVIIARLTRPSLSSDDVKAAELEKVSKVGASINTRGCYIVERP